MNLKRCPKLHNVRVYGAAILFFNHLQVFVNFFPYTGQKLNSARRDPSQEVRLHVWIFSLHEMAPFSLNNSLNAKKNEHKIWKFSKSCGNRFIFKYTAVGKIWNYFFYILWLFCYNLAEQFWLEKSGWVRIQFFENHTLKFRCNCPKLVSLGSFLSIFISREPGAPQRCHFQAT